jgi:hypothetical protein
MALTPGFQLPFGIQPLNPVPTDSWSGPYEGATEDAAIAAANAAIPTGVRFKSMEVRLVVDGSAIKYWYKDGTANENLVPFTQIEIREQTINTPTTYMLLSSDINNILTLSNGSNDTIVAIGQSFQNLAKIGTQVVLLQLGTGTISISSTTNQAAIISSFNRYKLVGQYSSAALIKISNNSWYLGGDIAV